MENILSYIPYLACLLSLLVICLVIRLAFGPGVFHAAASSFIAASKVSCRPPSGAARPACAAGLPPTKT